MKEIKKDTRAFERMVALNMTYASVSEKLAEDGTNVSAKTVWRYLVGRETPNKSMKKAIAKALNCGVKEIF
jgi:hypothetical protein